MWILDQQKVARKTLGQHIEHKKNLKKYVKRTKGEKCIWCNINLDSKNFTLDHIIPQSFKGTWYAYNLLPACRSCNSSRGNLSVIEFYIKQQEKGLQPNKELIVKSLEDNLEYITLKKKFNLYYISRQIDLFKLVK